tara:strand:+ start:81 stop:590 length:510 start_codon:yes stop_codon:yes gene_type:complete
MVAKLNQKNAKVRRTLRIPISIYEAIAAKASTPSRRFAPQLIRMIDLVDARFDLGSIDLISLITNPIAEPIREITIHLPNDIDQKVKVLADKFEISQNSVIQSLAQIGLRPTLINRDQAAVQALRQYLPGDVAAQLREHALKQGRSELALAASIITRATQCLSAPFQNT